MLTSPLLTGTVWPFGLLTETVKDSTFVLSGSETSVTGSSAGTLTVMTSDGSSVVSGSLSEGLNKQKHASEKYLKTNTSVNA